MGTRFGPLETLYLIDASDIEFRLILIWNVIGKSSESSTWNEMVRQHTGGSCYTGHIIHPSY